MSEFKGQLLGMLLVITIFGIISAIVVPMFRTAANDVASEVKIDESGKVTQGAALGTIEF